jgi:hypothetical protein
METNKTNKIKANDLKKTIFSARIAGGFVTLVFIVVSTVVIIAIILNNFV